MVGSTRMRLGEGMDGVQKARGRRGGEEASGCSPRTCERGWAGSSLSWGEGAAVRGLVWLGRRPDHRVSGLIGPSPTEETPFEVGIRVQIHSQEEPPIIDQLGLGVSPGYQTFVSCQQQQVPSHVPLHPLFKPTPPRALNPQLLRPVQGPLPS